MGNCPDPILCERRTIVNLINYLFAAIVGGTFVFVEFANIVIHNSGTQLPRDLFDAIPFIVIYLVGLASSPNVTICEDGLYIHTLWKIVYVTWADIKWATAYPMYTVVRVKHLTVIHRLGGIMFLNWGPIFTLSKSSHTNYDEAIGVLKYRLGGRFR